MKRWLWLAGAVLCGYLANTLTMVLFNISGGLITVIAVGCVVYGLGDRYVLEVVKCPHCGKKIKAGAKRCQHCHVAPEPSPKTPPQKVSMHFTCPKCRAAIRLSASVLPKVVACPSCHVRVPVSAGAETSAH